MQCLDAASTGNNVPRSANASTPNSSKKKKKCETEKFNLYMAIERLFVLFVALLVMPSGSLWQQIHFIQFLTNCQ